MNNYIFALDIGTRSIVGVVCENVDGILKVVEIKSHFHSQRSMIDGQIEDIAEVSKVIGIVKEDLEKKLDTKLNKVCIAAAGRTLKTERILLEKEIDFRVPITADFIKKMETEALQLAQDVFIKDSSKNDLFYCVGYSVLSYSLDGKTMSKIENHRGNKVSVEIIAAFLPHTVIEGLYYCMDINNLEVNNLTLEPIAAMDLIIPPDLRLLNLSLVDIGAGTSDIAISKNGSVVGYDMATIAGDEITECIMKNFLVDFNTAEYIKAALSESNEIVSFTNILGMDENIEKKEILESIKSAVYELCTDISQKISKMNSEPPAAVFLAGGGSKTPFLREFLSELLNIPMSRIGLTDKKSLRNVDLTMYDNYGTELITPIGIAYSVILNRDYDFFSVSVNDKKVRLYGIRQMKVMDAILMSGIDTRKLIGISGKSLRFALNGQNKYYNGELSTPSQIYVNSNLASIETIIKPGDKIQVIPAKNGTTPIIKIKDLISNNKKGFVYFNGIKTDLSNRYFANKIEVNESYIINNFDDIEVNTLQTINDLYKLYKVDESKVKSYIKGQLVNTDCELYDGCEIILSEDEIKKEIKEEINNMIKEEVKQVIQEEIKEVALSTSELNFMKVKVNDKIINLPKREDGLPYIFADMLMYTDIDPSNPKGKIVLLHNNKEASYINIISDNDEIQIKWDSE